MNGHNLWSSVAELWHCSDLICGPLNGDCAFLTLNIARINGGCPKVRSQFSTGKSESKDQGPNIWSWRSTIQYGAMRDGQKAISIASGYLKTRNLSTFHFLPLFAAVWPHKSVMSKAKDCFLNQQNVSVSFGRQKEKRKRRRKCLHRPTSFFNPSNASHFSINFCGLNFSSAAPCTENTVKGNTTIFPNYRVIQDLLS